MTPADARLQAEVQVVDLINGLAPHWLRIPSGVRRLVLATVADPAARSDEMLLLGEELAQFGACITHPGIAARRMAVALTAIADALTALAPSRA